MADHDIGFVQLAERVGDGDPVAARQLRRQLQPQMVRMVRGALTHGGTSPVARRILAAARHLAPAASYPAADGEDIVQVVARSLCDCVMARLKTPSSHPMNETVRS